MKLFLNLVVLYLKLWYHLPDHIIVPSAVGKRHNDREENKPPDIHYSEGITVFSGL